MVTCARFTLKTHDFSPYEAKKCSISTPQEVLDPISSFLSSKTRGLAIQNVSRANLDFLLGVCLKCDPTSGGGEDSLRVKHQRALIIKW